MKRITFFLFKSSTFFFLLFVTALESAYAFDRVKEEQKAQMELILSYLEHYHYDAPLIDDQFSVKVYQLYMKELDPEKWFLTQEDSVVFSFYKDQLDDELTYREYDFYEKINSNVDKKFVLLSNAVKDILSRPFDFSLEESIQLNSEKRAYAKDTVALKEQWCKYLKYLAMEDIHSVIETQNNAIAEKDTSIEIKSFEVIEQEVRQELLTSYVDYFDKMKKQSQENRFAEYVNAVVHAFDPHSDYFTPYQDDNFDINFSGYLEGIGTTVNEKGGYVVVDDIRYGAPASIQGGLEVGDVILRIGQGKRKSVDVYNVGLEKVIQLLRGEKGSTVTLTVRKPSGEVKEISIVRDVIVLEETFARSLIIQDKKSDMKIGYIDLPGFYFGEENNSNRTCSEDIRKELQKIKDEAVDGIILDLRNNGGGSTQEATKIGGFFIDSGPMGQLKRSISMPDVREDMDRGIDYEGPLVILVNQFSASASELLAAAMQDYKRAIIIGSPTYGKGTAQWWIELKLYNYKNVGNLHLTGFKFYRINGGSTQLKGVVPDIILPNFNSEFILGEKKMDFPLPWDKVETTDFHPWVSPSIDLAKLIANSKNRVDSSEAFTKIREDAAYLKRNSDNTLHSLNMESYKEALSKSNVEDERYNQDEVEIADWEIRPLKVDAALINHSLMLEESNDYVDGFKNDQYLYESMHVIQDMLR